MGMYPAVSLADARARRDEAKKLLAHGVDPSVQKKLDRLAAETASRNTFGLVAEEYVDNLRLRGRGRDHRRQKSLAAWNGCADRRPSDRGDHGRRNSRPSEARERSGRRETARRMRSTISAVFRLAVATLRATNDPTFALRGALVPPNVKPRAAITDERSSAACCGRSTNSMDGPRLRAALKFCALTFARPGEVRGAKRSEFNFEKAVWRISAERTKMRRPHDIPLSRQALAVLRDVWPMSGERTRIPVDHLAEEVAVRKLLQFRAAAHGLHPGGNDLARLPIEREHDPQRARLQSRRDRGGAGPSVGQPGAARL